MTVLIWELDSEARKRVCNSRCYDAADKKCECICGGRNHGVGYENALKNTWLMQRTMINNHPRTRAIVFNVGVVGPTAKDIVLDPEPELPLNYRLVEPHHLKTEE